MTLFKVMIHIHGFPREIASLCLIDWTLRKYIPILSPTQKILEGCGRTWTFEFEH